METVVSCFYHSNVSSFEKYKEKIIVEPLIYYDENINNLTIIIG